VRRLSLPVWGTVTLSVLSQGARSGNPEGWRLMLRRSPLRRTGRVGRRARERVKAGGKLAVGRDSETLAGWRALKARVVERANGRCERCGTRRSPIDPHHVTARSRGGADLDTNVIALCRWGCHRQVSAPYRSGRLLVTPLILGHFCLRLVIADHKGAPQTVVQHEHTPTRAWLAAQGKPLTGPEGYGPGVIAGCPHGDAAPP
jgi:hypothetical protein